MHRPNAGYTESYLITSGVLASSAFLSSRSLMKRGNLQSQEPGENAPQVMKPSLTLLASFAEIEAAQECRSAA